MLPLMKRPSLAPSFRRHKAPPHLKPHLFIRLAPFTLLLSPLTPVAQRAGATGKCNLEYSQKTTTPVMALLAPSPSRHAPLAGIAKSAALIFALGASLQTFPSVNTAVNHP
jgi:hypothetical protein